VHGPMGIETTFQSFVKQWIKLPGESWVETSAAISHDASASGRIPVWLE
jgi:hypothetical protein